MRKFRPLALNALSGDVDVSTVALFRIAFGAVLFVWSAVFLFTERLPTDFIEPQFYFTYPGLEWIAPLPGWGMYAVFALLCLSCLGVMAGLFYRASAAIFTILFTYTFLIDRARYQNHYYLICLLGAIFTIIPAHADLSLDRWRKKSQAPRTMPAWGLALLRFQLAVPYFFGAIAKINSDWLRGQPMHFFLKNRAQELPWLEALLTPRATALFVSWTGLFFDFLIVPALVWRRSRPFALVALAVFHLTNSALFNIDVFPYLMLAATIVFFEPGWARRTWPFARLWPDAGAAEERPRAGQPVSGLLLTGLALHALVQLAVPSRVFFEPGDVSWHEVGHYFSWHMMLRSKNGTAAFFVKDPLSGKTWEADPHQYLSERQVVRLARSPEMLWQFSHFLADRLSEGRPQRVQVRVGTYITFNGRKPQLMINPMTDLGSAPDEPFDWILPIKEPFEE